MTRPRPFVGCVLLGDVVRSTRLPSRPRFQAQLAAACRTVNGRFGVNLAAGLRILKGIDEVGGVLRHLAAAYDTVVGLLESIRPVRMRFAVVRGEIDVSPRATNVAIMDGPAFEEASGAVAELKRTRQQFALRTGDEGSEVALEAAVNALLLLRSEWTLRQAAVVAAYVDAGSQVGAARRLRISQQAVGKALRETRWREVAAIEGRVRILLDRAERLAPGHQRAGGHSR